jgi:Family of unknown function (DUF5906)/RepB DNA-primase from phage plasmid
MSIDKSMDQIAAKVKPGKINWDEAPPLAPEDGGNPGDAQPAQKLLPDRAETDKFLTAAFGSKDAWLAFQTADDNKTRLKDPHLTRSIFGRHDQLAGQLAELNAKGAAVWVGATKTKGDRRKKENVHGVWTVPLDFDEGAQAKLDAVMSCTRAPDIVVESSLGKAQCHWANDGSVLPMHFEAVTKRLLTKFGGDPAVGSLTQVMRLPGYWHQKDPDNPFMVRVAHINPDINRNADCGNTLIADLMEMTADVDMSGARAGGAAAFDTPADFDGVAPTAPAQDASNKRVHDQSSHLAPSLGHVAKALGMLPNTPENIPSHRDPGAPVDFVRMIAGTYSSTGGNEPFFAKVVEPWALKHAGSFANPPTAEYVRERWDSFRRDGVDLGWAWLSDVTGYNARYGADEAFVEPPSDADEAAMATPDPATVTVNDMLERYAYVLDPDIFFDLETQSPRTSTQFDRSNRLIAPPGSKGTKAAHNIFLKDPRHKRARALTYSPGKPTIVQEELEGRSVGCVNTWRPSSLIPVTGDATPWLNHVAMLTKPEGPEASEYLLNCLAHTVQKRGDKRNHAILLCSRTQGTGKDTLTEPILKIIGAHNVSKITEKDLRSDFSPWLKKELVVLKEVSHLKKEEITGIKGYIAGTPEDTVRINEKNMKAFEIPNRQNWIMYSNEPDALALSDSDRRFWICQCTEEKQPEKYFNELYAWYEGGGTAAVAAYLLARDISRFNPKAAPPMTKAKQAMIDLARPEHERWLEEQFAEDGDAGGGKFARFSIVTVAEIKGDWDAPHGLTSRNIPAALRAAGFKPGPSVKLDGKNSTPTWLRGRALLAKDSPKILKETYTKERREAAVGGHGAGEAARGGEA